MSKIDKVQTTPQEKLKRSRTIDAYSLVPMLVVAVIAFLMTLYAFFVTKQLKQEQAEIQKHFISIDESLKQTKTRLEEDAQTLAKNLQIAIQEGLHEKQDWLLLKARYCLELAQMNAHWSDDIQATIALLKDADNLLLNLNNQDLLIIRQTIAKEISELQAHPRLDVTSLLSQFDELELMIGKLTFKKDLRPTSENTPSTSRENVSSWRERLKNSMSGLEKLIIVQHNNLGRDRLLTDFDQTLIRENLNFNLQKMQWAVLQNNAKVYKLALDQNLQIVQTAFDTNSTATQAFIQQLKNLGQENIEKPEVNLTELISLLTQYIEKKNRPLNHKTMIHGGEKLS